MNSTFKSIARIVVILLIAVFVLTDAAVSAERIFYSIHFTTLKDLEDVNKQVNSMKEKGEVVFWEKTELTGVGKIYRVYMGRYEDWNDALAFRDKLKSSGVEGPLGIQWFSETVESKRLEEPPKLIVSKRLAFVQPLHSSPEKDRFVDNLDGTVTDTKTNLMWVKNGWRLEFISALPWSEAMNKVKSFRHGNYSDWRLPTIEEWNSLIDRNNHNPALIEPNPFENLISHMPYWSQTEYAYDGNNSRKDQRSSHSYIVSLWSGITKYQKKSERAFILPVRSMSAPKLSRR